MKKQFALVAIIVCVCLTSFTVLAAGKTTISEANIPSEPSASIEEEVIELEALVVERVETTNIDILNQKLNECGRRMEDALAMAEAGRALGYAEDHPVIVLAQKEWNIANDDYNYYQNIIETVKKKAEEQWLAKMRRYPAAAQIWQYMKDLGWNDYVCAGIMGNLMTEAGGQTLKIQYDLVYKGHYGICQWSEKYYPSIQGANLDEQLDFLKNTIKYQIDLYGNRYEKGFNYNKFLKMTDVRKAADAFAKCYERNGTSTLRRQNHAVTAYKFFVD